MCSAPAEEVKGHRRFNWVKSDLKPVLDTWIWTPLKTPKLFTRHLPPLGLFLSWTYGARAFWPLFGTKEMLQRTRWDVQSHPRAESLAFSLIDFSRWFFCPACAARITRLQTRPVSTCQTDDLNPRANIMWCGQMRNKCLHWNLKLDLIKCVNFSKCDERRWRWSGEQQRPS